MAVDNPSNPYFLKVCFVCQEKSKDDALLATHYGGITCLSCRAFFRRAHQAANTAGSNGPDFTCKKEGQCSVTIWNRRRCQACRYNRCLRVGMKPSAVMTEKQVKARFKNMFQHRDQTQQPTPPPPIPQASTSHESSRNYGTSAPGAAIAQNRIVLVARPESSKQLGAGISDEIRKRLIAKAKRQISQKFAGPETTNVSEQASDSSPTSSTSNSQLETGATREPRLKDQPPSNSRGHFPDGQVIPFSEELTVQEGHSLPSLVDPRVDLVTPFDSDSYQNLRKPQTPIDLSTQGQKCHEETRPLVSSIYQIRQPTTDHLKDTKSPEFCTIPNYSASVQGDSKQAQSVENANQGIESSTKLWTPPLSTETQEISTNDFCTDNDFNSQNKELGNGKSACPEHQQGHFRQYKNGSKPDSYQEELTNSYMKNVEEHQELQKSYQIAEIQTSFNDQCIQSITDFHLGRTLTSERRHICSIMVALSKRFKHFALLQRPFKMLSKKDQRLLLCHSGPRYIQLVLGNYHNSLTAQEQLGKLFGTQFKRDPEVFDNPVAKNLQELNNGTHMFEEVSEIFVLRDLYSKHGAFPDGMYPYLALVILYSHCEQLEVILDNAKKIFKLSHEARLMLFSFATAKQTRCKLSNHWALDEFNLVLDKCALFFAHKFLWMDLQKTSATPMQTGNPLVSKRPVNNRLKMSDTSSRRVNIMMNGVKYHLMMPYTKEEESWICRKVELFDKAYSSVSIGENIVSEFVKGCLGEPFSSTWLQNTHHAFLERTWKILESLSEFQLLPVEKKLQLWTQNTNKASALFIIRGENATGFSQLQYMVGELDSCTYMEKYDTLFVRQQLKKVPFFATLPKALLTKLDQSIQREFRSLSLAMGPTVGNDQILKTFCLVKLMTPPQEWFQNPCNLSSPEAKFMKMYSKTFTLLRRRVLWKTFLNSGITDDDALLKAVEENYSVFVENLENIDRCSEVISQILVPKETPNFSEDLTP